MDDVVLHLCDCCLHVKECWEAHSNYPILECWEFESDEEPYPDGDAYWEYMNASLYGKEAIGHEGACGLCEQQF